jgi:isopentenyl diphosphate isomerase/L-lactate dehydrogenase-like FMN-dependent dehydrogenase
VRATEILTKEVAGTLALLGVPRLADVRAEHVLLRPGVD